MEKANNKDPSGMNRPLWIPSAKSASIRKWADYLHKEAKRVFLKDLGHAHILFLFKDEGPVSITPVPPKTDHAQITQAVRQAVRESGLYGAIHVGEAWTYFQKDKKDHTAFQLLDGEMRVSDLKDGDRTECLYLRMESRDGDCVIYIDRIEDPTPASRIGDAECHYAYNAATLEPDSDILAVCNGLISVTPVSMDLTSRVDLTSFLKGGKPGVSL